MEVWTFLAKHITTSQYLHDALAVSVMYKQIQKCLQKAKSASDMLLQNFIFWLAEFSTD